MTETIPFDKSKPHSFHQQDMRMTTFDQNGQLYDGVTAQPLEWETVEDLQTLGEKYAIPFDDKGRHPPFSKIKSDSEKFNDALETMRASGVMSLDDIAKIRAMVGKVATAPEKESKGVLDR